MRICIDAHGLNSPQKTGKHHYATIFLNSIAQDHDLYYFHSRFSGVFYYLHFLLHLLTHSYDLLLLPLSYIPILFSNLPTITIIYDLAYKKSSLFHPNRKAALIEKYLLPLVLRRSIGLITLNRHLVNELKTAFAFKLPPAVVIPGTPRPLPPPKALNFKLPSSYFLYLGTLEPRKNLLNLLKGYRLFLDQLGNSNPIPQLVLAGKPGWEYQSLYDYVQTHHLKNQVWFLGYVSDAEATYLYQHAICLVYIPFYEGFGLPLIEALTQKLPLITTDHPVLKDTAGPCALYINPHQPKEICTALKQIYLYPQTHSSLKGNIPTWIDRFTPETTSKQFNTLLSKINLVPPFTVPRKTNLQ